MTRLFRRLSAIEFKKNPPNIFLYATLGFSAAAATLFFYQNRFYPSVDFLPWHTDKKVFLSQHLNSLKWTQEELKRKSALYLNNLAITEKAHNGHANLDKIYEYLELAYQLSPDEVAENFALVNMSMSDVKKMQGDLAGAKKYHQTARDVINRISLDTLSFSPLLAFGYFYQQAFSFEQKPGDMEQAITYYQKACDHSPQKEIAHCLLGEAYQQVKKHDEAISAFKKAIDINRYYGLAYLRIAQSYTAIGFFSDALQCVQKTEECYQQNGSASFPKEYQDSKNFKVMIEGIKSQMPGERVVPGAP